MTIEFNDQRLNIRGNNERALNFFDDAGVHRASIYLDGQGRLNVGNITFAPGQGVDGGGGGVPVGLESVPFLALAGSAALHNERIFVVGEGLAAIDSGPGKQYTLRLPTPETLSVSSVNSAEGRHSHAITTSSNPGAAARILASTSAGALTLQQLNVDNVRLDGNTLSAQSGDLTLTAAGGDVLLPSAINIGANNFVSQLTGWRISYAGAADFRNIYADELHVKAFIADIEQALAGGQIISKSVALLADNFRVPVGGRAIITANASQDYIVIAGDHVAAIDVSDGLHIVGSTGNDGTYTVQSRTLNASGNTQINVNQDISSNSASGVVYFWRHLFVENLPGFENTAAFANNDWIRLRVIDRSGGGLVVADVWGQVDLYMDLSAGQRWRFISRDDGGVPGNVVHAGALALDYGQSGDGWHEVTALDPDGPYSQIVTWTTNPTNPANYTLRTRLGNLDGVTDGDFPSIGGWGLYSTNAYLKGTIHAAGGEVVIGDDGIQLAAGSLAYNAITWWDGAAQEGKISITIQGDMLIEAAHHVVITSGNILSLKANSFIEMDKQLIVSGNVRASGGYVYGASVQAGGTIPPDYRLDVRDNSGGTYAARIFNDGNNNNRNGMLIRAGAYSNPSHAVIAFQDGDGTGIGSITGNGSGGVSYNTTSDERRKEDITPMSGALSKVLALEPVKYRGKGAPRNRFKRPGLVAQKVRGVMPEIVTEDDDGILGLDYMSLIPYLIAAVQELASRIEALEAR